MQPCTAPLICPVCNQPLHAANRSLRCSRGHTFDRAREGYVDLLPAGHGRSRIRGDTAEMLRARRRFLGRGHYEPLSRAVSDSCARHLSRLSTAGRPDRKRTVVDVGCGDGYYLGRAQEAAAQAAWGANVCFYGLDVSKHAVRLAARAYKRSRFIGTTARGTAATRAVTHVAAHDVQDLQSRTEFLRNDVNHLLCFADRSVDILLDIFAPRNPGEFERVLQPEGLLIVVVPHENHLQELRSALPLLEIGADKLRRTVQRVGRSFSLVGRDSLEYERDMGSQDESDLLRMTPNSWHLSESAITAAARVGSIRLTIGFDLLRFQKAPPAPSAA